MNWREVEFGIFPSSQRRGGCGINKSREATEEAADGREARARQREAVIVISSAKCLGLNSFAELTTPAAPISERIHFMDGASTPPLREGEYSAAFLFIAHSFTPCMTAGDLANCGIGRQSSRPPLQCLARCMAKKKALRRGTGRALKRFSPRCFSPSRTRAARP